MTVRRPMPTPVTALLAACDTRRATMLGEPYATDFDAAASSAPLLHHALRPEQPDTTTAVSTRWFTEHALAQIASLLHAPAHRWRGAVCESLLTATLRTLMPLRRDAPDLVLYRSAAAHPHLAAAAEVLDLDSVVVPVDRRGAVSVSELAAEVRRRRSHRAVVVATLGTPATGALDDVAGVRAATDLPQVQRHLHLDAPLEGLARAVRDDVPASAGFSSGADSIVVAADQFLGVQLPCAVTIHRTDPARSTDDSVGAAAALDIGSGHAAVLLWLALHEFGVDGLARRARRSDALARYTLRRLQELGWPAWRHPGSMTVVLRPPSLLLRRRWSLRVSNGWARIVCVPGVTEAHIDRFIAELGPDMPPSPAASTAAADPDVPVEPAAGRGPAQAA
ncbi:pyridoxal-dependent decarboxylase [Dactylosporangium sp. NPDC005572]|uniref:pyridoxal-dependent decarboxylase n=1 Tax=Dactylosporangium sp. NPDC005572 TaxID=3156889 RepID=UPI0033BF7500